MHSLSWNVLPEGEHFLFSGPWASQNQIQIQILTLRPECQHRTQNVPLQNRKVARKCV